MTRFVQLLFSGVAIGSIYGLIALGFVLVYKATRVFNFAQGDLMMVGAYLAVTFAGSVAMPMGGAIPLVLACAALLGVAIHYVIARPLLGKPLLAIVMVTIGLSLVIQASVQIIYGPLEKVFDSPIPDDVYNVAGIRISTLDLFNIGVSALCLVVFGLFFRLTTLGLQMRAAAEHPEAAVLSGVNADRVSAVAWAIGAVLAAVAGIVLAQTQLVQVGLAGIGLLAFPAVVIGGLESLPGAVLGGILVGVFQAMAAGYVSPQAETAVVYAMLLVFLLLRPYGLFGEREIIRV